MNQNKITKRGVYILHTFEIFTENNIIENKFLVESQSDIFEMPFTIKILKHIEGDIKNFEMFPVHKRHKKWISFLKKDIKNTIVSSVSFDDFKIMQTSEDKFLFSSIKPNYYPKRPEKNYKLYISENESYYVRLKSEENIFPLKIELIDIENKNIISNRYPKSCLLKTLDKHLKFISEIKLDNVSFVKISKEKQEFAIYLK